MDLEVLNKNQMDLFFQGTAYETGHVLNAGAGPDQFIT